MSTLNQSQAEEHEEEVLDPSAKAVNNPALNEEDEAPAGEDAAGHGALEDPATDESVEEGNELGSLLKTLEEAQINASENRDRYLRSVAEHENFRKRVVREKEQLLKYGMGSFVEDLLPALDSLVLGLETARRHPEAKAVTDGFAMVLSQLEGVLKANEVIPIEPEGETFDPNLHDCVQQIASDEVEEEKVLTVIRKGYRLHDRLLRPATVVVSTGSEDPAPSATGDDDGAD